MTASPGDGIQAVEIQTITISVDGETSPASLKSEMRTVETPTSLSIFFYEHIWERLGSPRSIYDPAAFERDIVRLKQYFSDRGFFHAVIDTSLRYRSAEKMDIEIRVKENVRSLIDTVTILGIGSVAPDIAEDIRANSGIKAGMPYSTEALEQERQRALRVFHNGGYPDAEIDAIVPVRYLSTNNISVSFRYVPGRRYVFGPVSIASDTAEVDRTTLMRQLDFSPGEVYNEEKKTSSEQNLNRLGLLDNAALKPMARNDAAIPPVIPMQMTYRVLELKEITPEVEVNDENNQFTTGVGLGYSHRNFFGNASTFSVRARVRLQNPQNLDWGDAFRLGLKEPTLLMKADIAPQVYFPYFLNNRTSANVSLTLEGEKQEAYTLNAIRGRFGVTNKLATYTTGYAEWILERVEPTILNPLKVSADEFTNNRAKQFNSILTLTLQRDKTDNLFSPTSGFSHTVSLEESGGLPRMLQQVGSPRLKPSLDFSEYVKTSFLIRQFLPINDVNSNIIAMKFKGGAAFLYNTANPFDVPLTRKFYAGGSGSVRGWNFRQLTTLGSSAGIGGKVELEASLENRIQLFRNWGKFYFVDLEAMWGVLFVDVGNLWDRPRDIHMREVAVAAGLGLRYETFIGPVRFDIGLRVYDPKESPGNEWVFSKRLLHDSFSVFHFGLGHAF
ncbi:MAG: outer membrane protein assembly factor [Acidobacteriota bacterium]